ncbi:hypothetical protein ES708_32499 [subsurface metagenome]
MTDCSECKKALKAHKGAGKRDILLERSLTCKGKDYFEPGELLFCPLQIKWITLHFPELFSGRWAEGREVQFHKRPRPGGGGYFERPIDYAAEVERRLHHAAPDGTMVLLHYAYEHDLISVGKYFRLSRSAIEHRIEVVVWYVSGWSFNDKFPYRRWHVDRNYEAWLYQLEVKATL